MEWEETYLETIGLAKSSRIAFRERGVVTVGGILRMENG